MKSAQAYPFQSIGLDAAFPALATPLFIQRDRPITWLHFHDCHELGLCLEGAGVFIVEDKILPFKAGDAVFIARGDRHLARSLDGCVSKWRWLYCDCERLLAPSFRNAALCEMARFSGPSFPNVLDGARHPALSSLVGAMLADLDSQGSDRRERVLAHLLLFSSELGRAFPELGSVEAEGLAFAEEDALRRLRKALEEMARNPGARTRLARLPALCGLSPTHFRRLFRKCFGRSARDYVRELRLSLAQAELKSSARPVSEIALSCGFETLSSFNRLFKAQLGMAPGAWRRAQGGGA